MSNKFWISVIVIVSLIFLCVLVYVGTQLNEESKYEKKINNIEKHIKIKNHYIKQLEDSLFAKRRYSDSLIVQSEFLNKAIKRKNRELKKINKKYEKILDELYMLDDDELVQFLSNELSPKDTVSK